MKLSKCERCGKSTADVHVICPDCMKASGATAAEVEAAEQLRDIARVLAITADTDTNIRESMNGLLNLAARLERSE